MSNPGLTFARHWHQVSAGSQRLGPLSVQIATLLMGKHKPRGIYSQANDQAGDYVVVTDAQKVNVSGKKAEQKLYYRHSGYPGGLKTETFAYRLMKKPEEIIRDAVSGMLPKNKLRDRRLERLKIFIDEEHPYAANISRRYDVVEPQVSVRGKAAAGPNEA